MEHAIQIGVAGAAECDATTYALAEAVGREIAKSGAVLLCGGRLGVMEASAKGATAEGGVTVGILPGNDRREANSYIRYGICTGMGQARNVVFVLSTDVLIAVGGEYGTLSEIAIALKHRIPVVGLKSWTSEALSRKPDGDPLFRSAETAEEAVEEALRLAGEAGPRGREIPAADR